MADVYVEYMVKRLVTPAIMARKAALAVGGVVAFIVCMLLAPSLGALSILLVLAGFGLLFLAWRMIRSQAVEYEYSITNGEVDVDKIVARTSRKRLYSFHCRDVESLTPYDPKEDKPGRRVIAACTHPRDPAVWRCVVKDKGGTVLLINLNDSFFEAMKKFLPGVVGREALHHKGDRP